MKIITILLPLALFVFSCASMAQSAVYKHVDQYGQTVYSNIEIKGASGIDLPKITVLPAVRYGSAIPPIKKSATLPQQNEAIDKKIDQESKQVHMSEAVRPDSSDEEVNQSNAQERVQQIMEEMALYENNIEALEIELYNLGSGIDERAGE